MLLRYWALIGTHITCLLFGGWIIHNHDDVTALKLAEIQKSAIIANMQIVNQRLQNILNISELTNQQIITERDTIIKEYQYANDTITKQQKIINTKSHIDYDSWVRVLNSAGTTTPMQQITSHASGNIPTNQSDLPAAIVLQYTVDMKKDRDNCAMIHNKTILWYNKLRNEINN